MKPLWMLTPRSLSTVYTENSVSQPLVILRSIWDEQALSHFQTNQVLQTVITPIHYLLPGPPDAGAY